MSTIASLNEFALLGRSGLRVSPLCLGTMTFGTDWGWGAPARWSSRSLPSWPRAFRTRRVRSWSSPTCSSPPAMRARVSGGTVVRREPPWYRPRE